jgi:hypothetical protein
MLQKLSASLCVVPASLENTHFKELQVLLIAVSFVHMVLHMNFHQQQRAVLIMGVFQKAIVKLFLALHNAIRVQQDITKKT